MSKFRNTSATLFIVLITIGLVVSAPAFADKRRHCEGAFEIIFKNQEPLCVGEFTARGGCGNIHVINRCKERAKHRALIMMQRHFDHGRITQDAQDPWVLDYTVSDDIHRYLSEQFCKAYQVQGRFQVTVNAITFSGNHPECVGRVPLATSYEIVCGVPPQRNVAYCDARNMKHRPHLPAPSMASHKTVEERSVEIYGRRQAPLNGNIYYVADVKIPNAALLKVENPNLGNGKQWIVQLIPPGGSSNDCGKRGKTRDIRPGGATDEFAGAPLDNVVVGFCLVAADAWTAGVELPGSWALRLRYREK